MTEHQEKIKADNLTTTGGQTFITGGPGSGWQKPGKKVKKDGDPESDFYDIVKGGFVNVKAGDILVDKSSFAQGMGGPPGAAIPSIAEAGGAGGAGGAGQTINIQVTAVEKDLAGRIANQIKKELYNRQIATSSYSLS